MSKKDLEIYDTKKKEYFDPEKRRAKEDKERAAKKAALLKKRSQDNAIEKVDVSNPMLKTMHQRVNDAETEEEATKAEKRLERYKKHFSNKGK